MKNTKVDFEEIICNFDDDKVVVKTNDGIFKIINKIIILKNLE